MKLPFLGQAYASRSPILAAQTAINVYPELSEQNSQEIGGFYGTPGLTTKYSGPSAEVRGLHDTGAYLFAVIGSTVYRLSSTFAATNLGTLPNSSGRVSIESNETQVAIAHADGWHWVAITGSAIAAVVNSPTGTSILGFLDSYIVYTDDIGGFFGITAPGDLSSLDPLDIADAEGDPDDLNSLICTSRELVLLGTRASDVYQNTGAASFPFERAPGGFVEQGSAAKFSPAKLDNSVFWLGHDHNGRGIVYRNQGFTPVRISTHAIEHAINGYSKISDAIGYAYQEEGHSFYVLTFPTGDATWVYDVATQGWHQRAWLDSLGFLHRHRGNCYATFRGQHLVGDYQNGKIYQTSLDVGTDAGSTIYRERAFDVPTEENKKIRMDEIELMMTLGDGTEQVSLEVSRDAGRTFGYERISNVGALGRTTARARWRRAGTARQPTLRFSTTQTSRVQWTAAFLKGEGLST